jgi:hypothetical protein
MSKYVDMKITLGNIITLVAMLVAGTMAYARIEARVDEQGKALMKLETSDISMLAKLEAARDLASARQEAISSRLTRMEAILERIERNGSRP